MDEEASNEMLEVLIRVENAVLFIKMNPSFFSGPGESRNKPTEGLQMQLIIEPTRIPRHGMLQK
jgi:hypothetical protein